MSSTNDQQGMEKMNNSVQICIDIDGWMEGLPAEPSSWPKIFQVPPYIRNLNEKAYEPKLISIGPYHCRKDHLEVMETHKRRFLKDLLGRTNQNCAQIYVEAMAGMMQKARNYYAESLVISNEEFFKMMVLDGCFIVELFCKLIEESFNDPILRVDQIHFRILKDLILVENQLPFFVLWEFLGMTFEDRNISCINAIIELFKEVMPGLEVRLTYDEDSIKEVKHLLELLCTNWLPSEDSMPEYEKVEEGKWKFIHSATKLREAGIKFRKADEGRHLFDIRFENGTLYIPAVNFQDHTEVLYFNIIAYEQFNDSGSRKYLTEYVTVMDSLIDTEKDVELLCQKEIMDHWLGTDEAAAKIFNRLGSELMINPNDFLYAKLFNDVNKHYHAAWNKRMASLKHNYFNTPWAFISFLAAAFLLLLTLLQTTFAIFPRS